MTYLHYARKVFFVVHRGFIWHILSVLLIWWNATSFNLPYIFPTPKISLFFSSINAPLAPPVYGLVDFRRATHLVAWKSRCFLLLALISRHEIFWWEVDRSYIDTYKILWIKTKQWIKIPWRGVAPIFILLVYCDVFVFDYVLVSFVFWVLFLLFVSSVRWV